MKAAVLANNPDMDQDERSLMESDLEKLSSFIQSVSTTKSIVGGMVHVVNMQDIAFSGRWRYNPRQDNDYDESSDDTETAMDEYLASIQEW